MSAIFVSYRRSDSSAIVGRVIDRLETEFGEENVFRDLEKIEYGEDFGEVISGALSQCRVLLSVIGREWEQVENETGQRRLDDPDDWVRREVSRALQLGIPVIPVLVENAEMPAASSLPDDLKPLARRNGAKVREDPDFDGDVARLCHAIRKHVGRPLWIRRLVMSATVLVAVGCLLVVGNVLVNSLSRPAQDDDDPVGPIQTELQTEIVRFEDKTTGEPILREITLGYSIGDSQHESRPLKLGQCEVLAGGLRNVRFARCGVGYEFDPEDQTKLDENIVVMRRVQLSPRNGPGTTFRDSILPEVHPMEDITIEQKFNPETLSQVDAVSPIDLTVVNNTEQHLDLLLIRSDVPLQRATLLPVCRPDKAPVNHRIPDTKPNGFYFVYVSRNGRRAEYLCQDILHGAFKPRLEIDYQEGREGKLVPHLLKPLTSASE